MVNNLADLAVTTFLAEQIKNVRIAVIGDVMLDRYFQGEVKRISPEAPVPVTRITKINSVSTSRRHSSYLYWDRQPGTPVIWLSSYRLLSESSSTVRNGWFR